MDCADPTYFDAANWRHHTGAKGRKAPQPDVNYGHTVFHLRGGSSACTSAEFTILETGTP